MLETSKDVLFLVISLSIAILTFFIAWAIYLVIKLFKQVNGLIGNIKEKIESFSEVLTMIKDKITHSASSLNSIASAVNKIIDFFKRKKEKEEKKEKKNF